jgi:hypothetical protein
MSDLQTFEAQVYEAQPDFLSGLGQPTLGKLAPAIESAVNGMQKRDWISVGRRAQVVACLRGANPSNIGNGYSNYKVAPSIGTPAERALQSVGLSTASERPVLCILGNAALSDGRLFEAFQLATLQSASVLFLMLERDLEQAPLANVSSHGLRHAAQAMGITVSSVDVQELQSTITTARDSGGTHLIHVAV